MALHIFKISEYNHIAETKQFESIYPNIRTTIVSNIL